MNLRTCVHPDGYFIYGIHRPSFTAVNLRLEDGVAALGATDTGKTVDNQRNFPPGDVSEAAADWIYEIPNPFPFRGATFLTRRWADARFLNPQAISLPVAPEVSLRRSLAESLEDGDLTVEKLEKIFRNLPESVQLSLATTSTDSEELIILAHLAADFLVVDRRVTGMLFRDHGEGGVRPRIHNEALFEALANNCHLPESYRQVMVLRPGAQGGSEIVGEIINAGQGSHIYEYLRRNSYIPWGHYAANMADDAVRYQVQDLRDADMAGLRHLYYQRTFVRLARGLDLPVRNRHLYTGNDLEDLRLAILEKLPEGFAGGREGIPFSATLWGWNYGFDYAPSHYRLHASHQQIHQQFALLPAQVPVAGFAEPAGGFIPTFGCGDLIADFIEQYRQETRKDFFDCYLAAIRNNVRMDGRKEPAGLTVWEDDRVILFVPKAQTSQWELQLMAKEPVGNILEADSAMRESLDRAMGKAVKALAALGGKMITSIEYSKRFDARHTGQRLLYCFLPRLPESPGAFSEAQMRWINGHYPEDFAAACRKKLG